MKTLTFIPWVLVVASSASANGLFCPKNCACGKSSYKDSKSGYMVKLYYKNLSAIPDLSGLTSVSLPKYFLFTFSDIVRVSRADFPEGLYVTHLNLGGNRRMVVEEDAFVNLKELEYLNLESTKVVFNTTLRFVQGLSSLKVLILSFTNDYSYFYPMADIHISLFNGLGLTSLLTLKMYNCGLRRLGRDVFLGAETITTLDLAGNRLDEFPEALTRLTHLESVDLSHCLFKEVSNMSFVQNTRLKKMRIMYSKLERVVPRAFEGLEHSLHELDLRDSNIGEFPGPAIKGLKSLKILKLDGNFITEVPTGSLAGLFCLEDLSMDSNYISFHEGVFQGQEDCVKHLYLRSMDLKDVPNQAVSVLNNLDYLFLDGNKIEVLTNDTLFGIKANLFVFADNPINFIHDNAFVSFSRPLNVILTGTSMTNINFTLSYPVGTFYHIGIRGLSIPCDCTLARLLTSDEMMMNGECVRPDVNSSMDMSAQSTKEYLLESCRGYLTSGTASLMSLTSSLMTILTMLQI